jgi:hypothetical protein
MYAFYADESGFSKSAKFESEQPILVVAGILVDITKLRKATEVFDDILQKVNAGLNTRVKELKFSEIRNKPPFKRDIPALQDRADLLLRIFQQFQQEISFKLLYCAIDNKDFFQSKATKSVHFFRAPYSLNHPYLWAAYSVLSQLDKQQSKRTNNKGKTFVIFDEQNQYQDKIEQLIDKPLHTSAFEAIFDTAYFGKSQYSKLIQIADLAAGLIRYYLVRRQANNTSDYWYARMEEMIATLRPNIIHKQCFDDTLKEAYQHFEILL